MATLPPRLSPSQAGVAETRVREDRALFKRLADQRDPVDREMLVERFLPLARSLAARYARPASPSMTSSRSRASAWSTPSTATTSPGAARSHPSRFPPSSERSSATTATRPGRSTSPATCRIASSLSIAPSASSRASWRASPPSPSWPTGCRSPTKTSSKPCTPTKVAAQPHSTRPTTTMTPAWATASPRTRTASNAPSSEPRSRA